MIMQATMKIKKLAIWLAAMLAVTVLSPLDAAAGGTSFSFQLTGPNTAMASSGQFSGDTIRMTGAGTFDRVAATVDADGSFKIIRPDGTVVERGTWKATAFTSFTSFGGPHPGFQGGVLVITVTLTPVSGAPLSGQSMVVNCLVNAPSGFTGDEGMTVGDFTTSTGGTTLFHN